MVRQQVVCAVVVCRGHIRLCATATESGTVQVGLQALHHGLFASHHKFVLSQSAGLQVSLSLDWSAAANSLACKQAIRNFMRGAYCRLQSVLLGTVMRRSCRLSTKQEHKLVKKAEVGAAEAAAAEAAIEGTSVYPSSVTKAIAGLATPSMPSPSMFPEDWRMVEELFHDGQVSAHGHAAQMYTHTNCQ